MIILIETLLLIGSVLFIGYPLFSKKYQGMAIADPAILTDYQQLLYKRDMVYSAIKDLEFDYKTGKLSEEDYHELKSQYELEAVKILEQIDKFSKGGGKEKKKAALHKKRGMVCPGCNTPYRKGDKFCSSCGKRLK